MLGIAVLVPLAAGVFDLSIGATINICRRSWSRCCRPSTTGACGRRSWSPCSSASLIGVVNGFLVVVLKISSFIATLATATIIGAVQVIVTNQTQPLPPTSQHLART